MEQNPVLHIGPLYFSATLLYMSMLTMIIVFGLTFWASRRMAVRPTGKQNVLEYVIELTNGIGKENLGNREAPRFSLLNFVLFSFLLISNNIGLMTRIVIPKNGVDLSYWSSPTANSSFTLTLAVLIMLLANFVGVAKFGFGKYVKNSFIKPPAFMIPLNIIEEFTNTLSLGLRIYGNIMAGEVMLGLICNLGLIGYWSMPIGIILGVLWIAFSIFISSLQAYVFVLLTNIYISHKILEEH
ncbi:MAG: F0F1 ATP synthase subunit A [Streptococcaceae bacterium]|nr:F0F1 ATP synthase subunit A [Streptococcaceae bacterium]